MDAVVRHWLTLTVGEEDVTTHGIGLSVAQILPLFYADDGLIGTTNATWLSNAFSVLVTLFRRIGLETNFTKTAMMVHHSRPPRTMISSTAYRRKITGQGPTFKERLKEYVECPICRVTLKRGSLQAHQRRLHGTEIHVDMDWEQDKWRLARASDTPFRASFPRGVHRQQPCPVPHAMADSRHQ